MVDSSCGNVQPPWLQWVHGPITVVMVQVDGSWMYQMGASMGPRSDNRGYVTKVGEEDRACKASMGPRSDNRGYVV